jgi:hypothetical protein
MNHGLGTSPDATAETPGETSQPGGGKPNHRRERESGGKKTSRRDQHAPWAKKREIKKDGPLRTARRT